MRGSYASKRTRYRPVKPYTRQQLYELKWIHSRFLDFNGLSYTLAPLYGPLAVELWVRLTHKERTPIGAYVEHQPCVKYCLLHSFAHCWRFYGFEKTKYKIHFFYDFLSILSMQCRTRTYAKPTCIPRFILSIFVLIWMVRSTWCGYGYGLFYVNCEKYSHRRIWHVSVLVHFQICI